MYRHFFTYVKINHPKIIFYTGFIPQVYFVEGWLPNSISFWKEFMLNKNDILTITFEIYNLTELNIYVT